MQIPILTYHSMNVESREYAGNDHVALARDLEWLQQAGRRVVSLETAFRWYRGDLPDAAVSGAVALTFDDGSWFDFYDLEHPVHGMQRSLFNILEDFSDRHGPRAQPELHASSFVIASPQARAELDRKAMIGAGWWSDEWWPVAQRSGRLGIECHSWDHNHPLLDRVAQKDQLKGSFRTIASAADCEAQVARAGRYIRERLGGIAPRFFAFPWGETSPYLLEEYLPGAQAEHGFVAAFTTEPRHLRRSDARWALPRWVCGRDWSSPAEFQALITDS